MAEAVSWEPTEMTGTLAAASFSLALGRMGPRMLEGRPGKVFVAPLDVLFSDRNVLQPDVMFVTEERLPRIEKNFVRSAPDIVIEVSSPSRRRLELVRKRELYERFGVPEFWYVDLEDDRVEVYRIGGDRYAAPGIIDRSGSLDSPHLPGFSLSVDELLGPPERDAS